MSRTEARSTIGRGSAHSVPWVAFATIAVCLGVFSLTQWSARQAHSQAEAELQGAIDYLIAHPYLEPDEVLAERVDPTLLEQRRLLERQARTRRSAPPIPRRVQQRQKEELDGLVASAFAGMSELATQRWGFRATEFGPLTLVTHVFLHESSSHLMLGLFLFLLLGFHLEVAWGSPVFAVVVPAAGVVSAIAYAAGNSDFAAPLIGTSGVVAALFAAYLVEYRSAWKQPVYSFLLVSTALFLILPARTGNEWSIAAGLERTVVLVGHQGASYWSFAGGFLFGAFAQFMIAQLRSVDAPSKGEGGVAPGRNADPLLEKAIDAHAAGRSGEAWESVSRLLSQHPDDYEALLVMWDVGIESGNVEQASAAMVRAIRGDVKRGDSLAAVDHWLDLCERGSTERAEPALLIRLSLMLERRNQRFAAIEALRSALAKSDGPSVAVVATRVARAARDLDADTAREAAWRALGSVDLDLEERQGLEEMLGEIGAGIDLGALSAVRGNASAHALDLDLEPARERQAGEGTTATLPEAWVDAELTGDDVSPVEATPLTTVGLDDLVSVDPGWAPEGAGSPASAIPVDAPERGARFVAATPLELVDGGLRVEVEGGAKRRLPLAKIEAIAVAAVGGLGPRPIIVIDLVMNWSSASDGRLKVLRLRTDRFDVRAFVREPVSRVDALRAFAGDLLRGSCATPLPDAKSAAGTPFASYDDLESYQRSVLGVG